VTASPSSFAELALPAVTAAYSAAGTDSVDDPHHAIESLLAAVREHLGIQVGFVCEFGETTRTFRYVDTDADHANLMVGLEEALGSTLLRRCDQPPLPAGRLVAAIRVALARSTCCRRARSWPSTSRPARWPPASWSRRCARSISTGSSSS